MTTVVQQKKRKGILVGRPATAAQRAAMREAFGTTVKPDAVERELDQALKAVAGQRGEEAYPNVDCLRQAVCPDCALLRSVLCVPGRRVPWFRCCGKKT